MSKAWRVVLVIVVICLAVGIVSAGVGLMTGADTERIGGILSQRVAERNNIDLDALIHEWVPEVVSTVKDQVAAA